MKPIILQICAVVLLGAFWAQVRAMADDEYYGKTTNGYSCRSDCKRRDGEQEYTCHVKEGKRGFWDASLIHGNSKENLAHCSPKPRVTYKGESCTSDCKKHLDYYYCDTSSSWDYCGPTQ